jgi:hypothetical protein
VGLPLTRCTVLASATIIDLSKSLFYQNPQ